MTSQPLFDIKLDKLTYGGDALGRLEDNRAVFVPFGLPGEKVRIRLVMEKKRFARAELIEILEPSRERIQAKCKHFGICGGCHYQNLPYQAQLVAKTEILRDQLVRIGKIENPPLQPIVGCPRPWNYRNQVGFHLTKDGKLGFVGTQRSDVIAIAECHLPDKIIDDFWTQLSFEPEAPFTRISLRTGLENDLMLVLESDQLEAPEMKLEAGISVIHLTENDALVMAGDEYVVMQVGERQFRVSAGSFFQVNTSMAEKLVKHLLGKLPLPAKTIMDVYCGVGLFSSFLAPKCERLIGIESSPSACEDFGVNLDEFDNVELYQETAEDVIPHLEVEQPVVLLDPARSGVDVRALDGIRELAPPIIAYVSCDPSTLARDSARLIAGGYRLVEITPFDFFPQTYHIESLAIFER